jgi:NAD(P)-dependent dehydrogenase (short-subunit alcohol dehydrogenase family)
LGRL